MTLIPVALSLVIAAQLVDPPCGTVVDIDETSVSYTQDLACPGAALDVQANDVDVDGGGRSLDATMLVSGDGVFLSDVTLTGNTGTGLTVNGSALLILDRVRLLGHQNGASITNASDVIAQQIEIEANAACLAMTSTGGDSELIDSALRDCNVGVSASFDAGATLAMTGNTVRALGGTTGVSLTGLTGFDPIEDNVVAGFALAWELVDTTTVQLDVGAVCNGTTGLRLDGAAGTAVSGSLGGHNTAIVVVSGTTSTALNVALSGNDVDLADQGTGTTLVQVAGDDVDADAALDACDNCAFMPNADQRDEDGDGLGDVCDPRDDRGGSGDIDADGVANDVDNCAFVQNGPAQGGANDQVDTDGDGAGDACDPFDDLDHDADGVVDANDNCVFIANGADEDDQADADSDAIGDACEAGGEGEGEGEGETIGEVGGALIRVTGLPAFDEDCPAGGTLIEVGVDDDSDGVLDDEEVDSDSVVCNGEAGDDGADGAQGPPGAPGQDGAGGTDGADGAPGFVDEDGDGVDDRATVSGGNCAQAPGAPFALWFGLVAIAFVRRRARNPVRQ